MENLAVANSLCVAPSYSIHVVESDETVVLYNQTKPLILQGYDKVSLFNFIQQLPGKQLQLEDLMTLPEELVQLVARLLQEGILIPS